MSEDRFYAVKNLPIAAVQRYKNATYCQKKYAKAFDIDNNGIFSQQEADLFNATTFSEQDNIVVFDTQVEEKGFLRDKLKQIRTVYKSDSKSITNIKHRIDSSSYKVVPYTNTHFNLETSNREVCPAAENVAGMEIEIRSANSYSKVYYNNKYMNCVTLRDGTKVLYPDGENGSIESHNQGGSSTDIGYSYGTGYDVNTGNYTIAGNGGYKISHDNNDDNYYTIFRGLQNAIIIGSKEHNRYELIDCNNCVVDSSKDGKMSDNIFIIGGRKNNVRQGENDVTRMAMSDFDVLVPGKRNINTDKLNSECQYVRYERHLFKPNEWIGVINRDVLYSNEQLDSIREWY